MSNKPSLKIIITPDSEVKLEVQGAVGQQCLTVTKDLEAALGGVITQRDYKPEFYAQNVAVGNQFNNQG